MTASNKKQMAFSYDNSIIVNSGHQPPVISAQQLLIKIIHPINLAANRRTYHAVLLTASVYSSFLALNFVLLPHLCTLMCNFMNVCTIPYHVHVHIFYCNMHDPYI